MLLKPTHKFKSVIDINIDFLENNNIKGLILDLDNTLTTHNNPKPDERILKWIENNKKHGIKMMIVSNNTNQRVTDFAKILKLDFVANGKKPLSFGFRKAQKIMELPFSNIAIVGDQIFTDILGANIKRVTSIFVHPIEFETGFFFKFKRAIENLFIKD